MSDESSESNPTKVYIRKTGRPALQLVKSDITALFDMSQPSAAHHLGVSVSGLKRECRKLGILQWPYKRSNNPSDGRAIKKASRSNVQDTSSSTFCPPGPGDSPVIEAVHRWGNDSLPCKLEPIYQLGPCPKSAVNHQPLPPFFNIRHISPTVQDEAHPPQDAQRHHNGNDETLPELQRLVRSNGHFPDPGQTQHTPQVAGGQTVQFLLSDPAVKGPAQHTDFIDALPSYASSSGGLSVTSLGQDNIAYPALVRSLGTPGGLAECTVFRRQGGLCLIGEGGLPRWVLQEELIDIPMPPEYSSSSAGPYRESGSMSMSSMYIQTSAEARAVPQVVMTPIPFRPLP